MSFNKKKEELPVSTFRSPWNKENGYCFDYTFATRLFGFLANLHEDVGKSHPMIEEEYEYLLECAAELKIWQMSIPTTLNKQYFNNLKGQKIDPKKVKYLNAIHCLNAFDVDKYMSKEDPKPENEDVVWSKIRCGWVAVNPDGVYKVFSEMPYRAKDKVMVEDLNTWEEDYYGKEYHPEIWNGEYNEYWSTGNYPTKGGTIDVDNLAAKFHGMTWKDEPKCLN